MQANELRIGNYVTHGNEKLCKVISIENDKAELSYDGESNGISWHYFKKVHPFIEPIPLTEEWLVKFGFEKKEDLNSKDYPFAHSIFTKSSKSRLCNEFKIGANQNGFHFYSMVYINYIHQLQNLYFALTGEELEIK